MKNRDAKKILKDFLKNELNLDAKINIEKDLVFVETNLNLKGLHNIVNTFLSYNEDGFFEIQFFFKDLNESLGEELYNLANEFNEKSVFFNADLNEELEIKHVELCVDTEDELKNIIIGMIDEITSENNLEKLKPLLKVD